MEREIKGWMVISCRLWRYYITHTRANGPLRLGSGEIEFKLRTYNVFPRLVRLSGPSPPMRSAPLPSLPSPYTALAGHSCLSRDAEFRIRRCLRLRGKFFCVTGHGITDHDFLIWTRDCIQVGTPALHSSSPRIVPLPALTRRPPRPARCSQSLLTYRVSCCCRCRRAAIYCFTALSR